MQLTDKGKQSVLDRWAEGKEQVLEVCMTDYKCRHIHCYGIEERFGYDVRSDRLLFDGMIIGGAVATAQSPEQLFSLLETSMGLDCKFEQRVFDLWLKEELLSRQGGPTWNFFASVAMCAEAFFFI